MESETTIPSHQDETKTESTEFTKKQKRYQDLIATFPHVQGWFSKAPLIEYCGHWYIQAGLEGCLHVQDFFQARPTDILVCTYPKSGTTWLKALTFTIANRSRLDDDSSNPLLKRNPHELVPFIETDLPTFISKWAFFEKEKSDQEHPDKVLFLKYEKLRADPLPHVKRLAEFMGYGFTAEEDEIGVQSFGLLSE
ncbi:PREDICTED: cytosolic sulfotransferase 18-like [Camelina sativa]|uniref:Sulfotransferase n=1 Tax=Camelina sativa TaxID=90675 RepID=A0ABM0YWP9_CAMSA|nr:PREDICTED: cytosolic sulfotransferase 18-like [Camelina sativa]